LTAPLVAADIGAMGVYIGIDIGGTFTDCAVLDDGGRIAAIAKATSTRDDPAEGVIEAVAAAAARLGVATEALLADCRLFVHGCTIATNAMVERKGVPTALLTTKGHEDAIFIGKVVQKVAGQSERAMTHQARLDKADPPIVPRRRVFGLTERIDRLGAVVVALEDDEIDRAIDRLAAEGVEAVAVSFLWSFLNDAHEARVLDRLRARRPDLYVSASHALAPVLGEYERTVTTVANAYVGPAVTRYLERLAGRLGALGYRYPLLLAHCMGGLTTMEEVRVRPLLTLDSGPVSGVLGARYFGAVYGEPNVLCADMGGTTFDVSLIERGQTVLDEEPVVAQYSYLFPKVAVESIGAGGGSIVWVDDNGLLRVGPESAGAFPGPACYSRGGAAPTVTDVNLVLGFLGGAGLVGGTMALDAGAAEQAVDRIARRLGIDRLAVASGAFRIVNAHMADLMRRSSIDRGRDPRDFVLFAYGGAAALHIAYLARELRIGRVYVPSFATVFSAVGMLTGGILHSAEISFPRALPMAAAGWAGMVARFAELRGRLDRLFDAEAIAPADRAFEAFVHVKYRMQPTALPVRLEDDIGADDQDQLIAAFEHQYHALYGESAGYRAAGIEILKLKLDGRAATVTPRLAPSATLAPADPAPAATGTRPVHFPDLGRAVATAIYDGERLRPGMRLAGPAVVERMGDTIVLPAFASAAVDAYGNVVLDVAVEPGVPGAER